MCGDCVVQISLVSTPRPLARVEQVGTHPAGKLASPLVHVLEQADGQVLCNATHSEVSGVHTCTCIDRISDLRFHQDEKSPEVEG